MIKRFFACVVLFSAFSLLCISCSSNAFSDFKVKIVDETGQPVANTRVILADQNGQLLRDQGELIHDRRTDQSGFVNFGQIERAHVTVTVVRAENNTVSTFMDIPKVDITIPIWIGRVQPPRSTIHSVELTQLPGSTSDTSIIPYVGYDFQQSDTTRGIFKTINFTEAHFQPDGKFSLIGIATDWPTVLGYGYSLDQEPTEFANRSVQFPINLVPGEKRVSASEPVEALITTHRKTIRFDHSFSTTLKEPASVVMFPLPDQDFFTLSTTAYEASNGISFSRFKRVETKFTDPVGEVDVSMPNVRVANVTVTDLRTVWGIKGDEKAIESLGEARLAWLKENLSYQWIVYFDPKPKGFKLPELPFDLKSLIHPPNDSFGHLYLYGFDVAPNYDTAIISLLKNDLSFDAGLNKRIIIGISDPHKG